MFEREHETNTGVDGAMNTEIEPAADFGKLEINWWTRLDKLRVLQMLANMIDVDVFGQDDVDKWTDEKIEVEIKFLAGLLANAQFTRKN